jgi:hypothetical protein
MVAASKRAIARTNRWWRAWISSSEPRTSSATTSSPSVGSAPAR